MEKRRLIRTSIKAHIKTGEMTPTDDYRRFRVYRSDADAYFDILPEVRVKVQAQFAKMRANGEKIVHIDICGEASACKTLKADVSYLSPLTMIPNDELRRHRNDKPLPGNIFDPNHFARLKHTVLAQDGAPALITFNPIAGLQDHDPIHADLTGEALELHGKVTYGILEKRLVDCMTMLKRGGYIFIEKPFQSMGTVEFLRGVPQEKRQFTLRVKELAEQNKCTVKCYADIRGPFLLVRRR